MVQANCRGLLVLFLLAAANASSLVSETEAQTLRYDWKDGQKFSYRFDITVNSNDATITYKGITNYTVDAASSEQLRVTYQGGLNEAKAIKRSRSRGFGGPFGRPMGPPSFPSPFSKPVFAGKTQTTNRITLTPRGKVLAMEGDSQLPYLLGNVSLLPFEPLPEGSEREWSRDTGVSISQESEDRRHRFGPNNPFAPQPNKSVQAGGEVDRYAVDSTDGTLTKVSRTYNLTTPQTGDKPAYKMTGKGTWVFDRNESVPHSLDMSYELTQTKGGASITIPISVKYTRISAEELAEMAAAKQRAEEERAQAAAEAKAKAEAPLTAEEKANAMSTLAASDSEAIVKTLGELATKTPKDADTEIAAAIERLLDHADKKIAGGAHKALLRWSPDYQRKMSLAKAYQGPGALGSTGRKVTAATPLFVGQLLQAQRKNHGRFWYAARIDALNPDGTVKITFLTWNRDDGSEVVSREKIQLAPDELPQPARPTTPQPSPVAMPAQQPGADTDSSQMRTWADLTGRFQVDAVFVKLADGKVSLRRADGRVLTVPLEKLSAADQAFVNQLQQAENPFFVE